VRRSTCLTSVYVFIELTLHFPIFPSFAEKLFTSSLAFDIVENPIFSFCVVDAWNVEALRLKMQLIKRGMFPQILRVKA
jgi:hypothetical protein